MRYRMLDADGDYTLNSFLVDSPECVAQAIGTRLRLGQDEWFLNTADGTPWNTKVLGKYTRTSYDPVIKERILGTPGALELVSYTSVFDSIVRALRVSAVVSTIYGSNVTIEETL